MQTLVPFIAWSWKRARRGRKVSDIAILCFSMGGLLASCGTGEARSIQTERKAAPVETPAKPENGGLRVTTRSGPSDRPDCAFGDAMTLIVLNQNREILRRDYCSAYGLGGARLVTDARGKHFVLLEYSDGHGTHATTGYLQIYEVEEQSLQERTQLMIREGIGTIADSVYDYRVGTPTSGGIIISGSWLVDGPLSEHSRVPSRSRTVIELDTTA